MLSRQRVVPAGSVQFSHSVVIQLVLVVKKNLLPANAGDIREKGWIPGSGRSPGGGHGNPLQYSCLENPMDGEAWGVQSMGCKESDTTEAT